MSIGDPIRDGEEQCPIHCIWLGPTERCPICTDAGLPQNGRHGPIAPERYRWEPVADPPFKRDTQRCPPPVPTCHAPDVEARAKELLSSIVRFCPTREAAYQVGRAVDQICDLVNGIQKADHARLKDAYDDQSRLLADARNELDRAKTHFFDRARGAEGEWVPFDKLAFLDMDRAVALRRVAAELGLVEEGEDVVAALTAKLPSRIAASMRPVSAHKLSDALGERDAAKKKIEELEAQLAWSEDDVRRLTRDNERLTSAAKVRRR